MFDEYNLTGLINYINNHDSWINYVNTDNGITCNVYDDVENYICSYQIEDTNIVTAEFNDWQDNVVPIVLKGVSKGTTKVYIDLFDDDTGWYLTTKTINVTVM